MNIATLLQYLPFLFQAGKTIPEILAFVKQVKTDLQQKGEWTQEADEAFRQEIAALKDDPDFQTDPVIEPPHP